MYFWGLVKKVVQQVEDLSFFLLFLLFYKKVKKSEKKYKKVFSTFPDDLEGWREGREKNVSEMLPPVFDLDLENPELHIDF